MSRPSLGLLLLLLATSAVAQPETGRGVMEASTSQRIPISARRPAGPEPSLVAITQTSEPALITGLSGDGTLVVGAYPNRQFGLGLAFLWTAEGGEIELTANTPYSHSFARAISRDGTRVVGHVAEIEGPLRPFLWSADKGIEILTADGKEFDGTALGMSANGRFVVGSMSQGLYARGWRWSDDGGFDLLLAPSEGDCSARDVSDDGTTVVGSCNEGFRDPDVAARYLAVVWRAGVEATVLAESEELDLVSVEPPCRATAVSGDGTVVVGMCRGQALRWESGSSIELGKYDSDEARSDAEDISHDGRVIVGTVYLPTPNGLGITRAVVWLSSGEVRGLEDLVAEASLETDLEKWAELSSATRVSDDGRVIAGNGILASIGSASRTFRAALVRSPDRRKPIRKLPAR